MTQVLASVPPNKKAERNLGFFVSGDVWGSNGALRKCDSITFLARGVIAKREDMCKFQKLNEELAFAWDTHLWRSESHLLCQVKQKKSIWTFFCFTMIFFLNIWF